MENVRRRGLAGLIAAAIALALLSLAPAIADEKASAYASEGGYAMLYDSGTLVLQSDAEPDGLYGALTQTFQGVENQALSFKGCASLRALDLSGVAMPNVKNAFGMFDGCSSLESLAVQGCAMPAVQDVSCMFRGCAALQTVDLSFLFGAPLVNMNEMLDGCSSLKEIDAKPLDISSCTTMPRMFRSCPSLAALDLLSFTSSSSVNMGYMFNNCTKLSWVSLGSGFVFAGNCKLPRPSSNHIPGADGFWHAASGGSYEPSGVPSGEADTYYAARSSCLRRWWSGLGKC